MKLEARGVSVRFGGVVAFFDEVSLSVASGEVLGLVGPNGSGKSTFLNAVTGLVPATGALHVDGAPLAFGSPRQVRRAGVLRTFQTPQVYGELSCIDNVVLSSPDTSGIGLLGAWVSRRSMLRHERERWAAGTAVLDRVGLAALATAPTSELSYGQQRMVEIARVIVGRPSVVLLDEPAAGLNSAETAQLADLLIELNGTGVSLVIVDHKIDFLDRLCDRLVVLQLGRVIATGTPSEVWADAAVVDAYLGDGAMILEVEDLRVTYGHVTTVDGVSLQIDTGEAVAFLGPNGAGKTSTLAAVSGLTSSSGRISFDGESIRGSHPEAVARAGLVHVPEGRHVFANLSVHENLQVATSARGRRGATFGFDEVYDLFPALVPLRRRPGWALSGGEQQMVAVGRALLGSPRLLMLDEPSLGLRAIVADAVFGALAQVRSQVSLLVVEQNTSQALELCDRAYVLVEGRIVLDRRKDELADRAELLDTYLGRHDLDVH